MAGSSETKSAYWVESSLRVKWLEMMEAEERTALLDKLVKHGLSTGEVRKVVRKQELSRRSTKHDDTGEVLMKKKLNDSRRDEKILRKEKNKIRKELGEILDEGGNKFKRRIRRLKQVVLKERAPIRKKNQKRVERDLMKKKKLEKANLVTSLPEDCQEFGKLRVFQEEQIQPEPPAPPMVASNNITLSKEEIKVLSKSPKFALRNILDKEAYMAEIEKGLIKDKYGRIGKEEVNGKVVEDIAETDEDRQKA